MFIFSIIALLSLTIAIISLSIAISGKPNFYWVSAVGIYVFSFLAGFSIGQFTVGLTFLPLTLAIAHSFHWIKNKLQNILFLCIGIVIGCLAVLFIDNYWLFLPFWFFI